MYVADVQELTLLDNTELLHADVLHGVGQRKNQAGKDIDANHRQTGRLNRKVQPCGIRECNESIGY